MSKFCRRPARQPTHYHRGHRPRGGCFHRHGGPCPQWAVRRPGDHGQARHEGGGRTGLCGRNRRACPRCPPAFAGLVHPPAGQQPLHHHAGPHDRRDDAATGALLPQAHDRIYRQLQPGSPGQGTPPPRQDSGRGRVHGHRASDRARSRQPDRRSRHPGRDADLGCGEPGTNGLFRARQPRCRQDGGLSSGPLHQQATCQGCDDRRKPQLSRSWRTRDGFPRHPAGTLPRHPSRRVTRGA